MEEYRLNLGTPSMLTDEQVQRICDDFKAHGYNVTPDAVMHNFNAWKADLKSGYRDEANGYHVYSACGCNDFYLWASPLRDDADWQETYEA